MFPIRLTLRRASGIAHPFLAAARYRATRVAAPPSPPPSSPC